MKEELIQDINNDLLKLEQLNLSNETDLKILIDLKSQLKHLKVVLLEDKDVSSFSRIYDNLKLPIKSLLDIPNNII